MVTDQQINPRYSLIIITFRRDDILQENLDMLSEAIGMREDCELVLIDNNEDALNRSAFFDRFRHATYYKPRVNRGVSGGRNDGLARAKGEILIFLDDDAFIHPPNFPDRLGEIFDRDTRLGAVAFKSVNYYTGKSDPSEFPHTNKRRDPDQSFLTFRFIGVGHAIRASALKQTGPYVDDFFYAGEEFDLSWRLIKCGYTILYEPDIWVQHKKHPGGRLSGSRACEQLLLNKLRLAYMHLPLGYFILNSALWCAFAIWLARGHLDLIAVARRYISWRRDNRDKRQPMGAAAIAYVRECGGAVWR